MTARTTLRTAFAAAITGLPLVGGRVFVSRTRPLTDSDLPAILVYSGESEVTDADIDGNPTEERWRLRADVLVTTAAGEAQADDILDAMRQAIINDPALQSGTTQCRYIGSGEVDLDDSLQKPLLRLPTIFEATFA